MGGIGDFLKMRDVSGAQRARAKSALVRACRLLNAHESVRDFVLAKGTAAEDLSVLTSPMHLAAATTFTSAAVSASPFGIACISQIHYLLVPVVTIGKVSIGLTVERETSKPSGEFACDAEAVMEAGDIPPGIPIKAVGRFAFATDTGELLIFTRHVSNEIDAITKPLSTMAALLGAGPANLVIPTCARVLWCASMSGRVGDTLPLGGATQAFLSCVVNDSLFRAGHFGDSLVSMSHFDSTWRPSCVECYGHDLARQAVLGASMQPMSSPKVCHCREQLAPVPSLLDLSGATRNMKALRGVWQGTGTTVFTVPGVDIPAVACLDEIVMSREIDRDSDLVSQLQALAIGDVMFGANVPSTVTPTLEWPNKPEGPPFRGDLPEVPLLEDVLDISQSAEAGTFTSLTSDAGNGQPSESETLILSANMLPDSSPLEDPFFAADISDFQEAVPAVLPELNPSDTSQTDKTSAETCDSAEAERLLERKRKEAARKQRNRESAARSNIARKKRNADLRDSLRAAKQRAVQLQTLEFSLRSQNIELRRKVAECGGMDGRAQN